MEKTKQEIESLMYWLLGFTDSEAPWQEPIEDWIRIGIEEYNKSIVFNPDEWIQQYIDWEAKHKHAVLNNAQNYTINSIHRQLEEDGLV